ncbi:MAG: lipoyl(octanoyl) transferase LipB [Aquisalimonadaceae bacterium]
MPAIKPPLIRYLGHRAYRPAVEAMRAFTDNRDADTPDELWVLEHPPVFTLGQNGKPEHILAAGDIPVVPVDRGGQVTYHGPGQVVVYVLVDVRRRGIGVRRLVSLLEQSVVDVLAAFDIHAYPRPDAPGVYVDDAKIAAVGLRIRRGASYHGLSLNVDMDLEPFTRINPCGHAGLAVTSMAALTGARRPKNVAQMLAQRLRDLVAAHPAGA